MTLNLRWSALFGMNVALHCHAMTEVSEQGRFVRVPIESIQLCVDELGLQTSDEVPSGLVEDVSFRIRQIADTACQFMRHAKRKCLTVDDMSKAIKYSGLEPLYGHQSETSYQFGEVILDEVVLTKQSDEHALPNRTPSISALWQMVEGVKLGVKEGLPETVQLEQNSSESQQAYLSLLLEAITGDDEDERRIALSMVQTNVAMANILPESIQYLYQTLVRWEEFTPEQLYRVMKFILSLFRNSGLFLDPYAPILYPLLKEVIFSRTFLGCEGEVHHWQVRQIGAAVLAQLSNRCASTLNGYCQDLSSHFQQLFSLSDCPPPPSLPVLYAAVLVLCHLGPANIAELLLPHLEGLMVHLNTLTKPSNNSITDSIGAAKVCEVLLVAMEVLLTSEVQVVMPSAKDPSSSSSTGHGKGGQPPLPPSHEASIGRSSSLAGGGEASSLFGSSSLTLSAVESSSVLGEMSEAGRPVSMEGRLPTPPPLSLYQFLFEIFGERLTLRLLSHHRDHTLSHKKPPTIPEPTTKIDLIKHTNKALERFLNREGYRSIHVQLPQKAPPPPSAPRGYYKGRDPWTFSIPRSLLPVPANVLEQRKRRKSSIQQRRVVKGMCVGQRRRSRQLLPLDVGSLWI